MSKIWVLTLLGLFTALVPFLGFPGGVRTFLVVSLGLTIAGLSFRMFVRFRYSTHSFLDAFREKSKINSDIIPPQGN